MAKYQQYEEYRDSGIEWLGVIPKDWISTQVKYGYTVVLGKMLQTTPKSNSDLLKPYLKAQNVQPSGIDLTNVGLMWFSFDERKRLLLKKKDILVSEGGDVGRAAIWNNEIEECYIQNAINRVRPRYNNDSRFFYYWINYLKSTDFINIICNKATIAHYTADKLQGSPLILPSALEQIQIANFLDHETAQIDTLIEKQQTLIQLLKEKRQAVISHAVTKGLNPNAPMKDSGVEWLGEVPEHWNVQRFKFLCDQIISGPFGSSITKDMYIKSGYKVYGQEQVIANDFEIGDYFISAKDFENLSRYKVKKGSILISCVGTFGKIAVFPFDAPEGIINPRLIQAKLNSGNDSFFIRELLKSETVYKQFELLSRGGTMGVINISILNEIIVATPNKSEQTEIYEYLVKQQNNFNGLIEKAEQAIQLMQERRTALISAAVTGKIDVRGWVAPESNPILESL